MSHEALSMLLETTLAGSAAIILVWVLRGTVASRFGAGAAYLLWTLVPAAMVAVLLPARAIPIEVLSAQADAGAVQPLFADALARPALAGWLVALWMSGVVAVLAVHAVRQYRFTSALGPLRRRADGLYQADACAGLPAVMGLLRPRIVVPVDFDHRYDEQERRLMLRHERVHLRRGDLPVNAAVALVRCLYWFNPLVHIAARRFRHDQELACDQAVIARFPQQRRAYGDAMLKTQLAVDALPLACHWGGRHLLKERIAMLKRPLPSRRRMRVGVLVVSASMLIAAVAAWAAQPAQALAPAGKDAGKPASSAPLAEVAALHTPSPEYPAGVAKQGISGEVWLKVLVGIDGKPREVQVEKAEPAGVFEEASVQAAKQWTFVPQRQAGKPTEGWIRVPIYFDARREPAEANGH